MFLHLSVDDRVSLRQGDDFKSFKLVIEGGSKSLDKVRTALANVAEVVDDEIAWVSEEYLRLMPEVRHDGNWQRSFSAMVQLAKRHGWVDKDLKAIKAHIEWPDRIQN
jgi:hypothetical protein